ncbi:MAG: hypothetical protein MZV70_30675 [Desulfobacterales bacterium]|nr:hypothetical protein [Desulfobacterales bacterium]
MLAVSSDDRPSEIQIVFRRELIPDQLLVGSKGLSPSFPCVSLRSEQIAD